ncbi:hypothetical protein V8G54_020849 [Vigna mungo]|uniref:Cytochrome c oxidase assembly protein COX11, mitochondrial n=1 Tax=Vigna mungo TaxID=3915 RepID=A0AAQ3RWA7_VIGMU
MICSRLSRRTHLLPYLRALQTNSLESRCVSILSKGSSYRFINPKTSFQHNFSCNIRVSKFKQELYHLSYRSSALTSQNVGKSCSIPGLRHFSSHASKEQKSQKMLLYLTGLVFAMVGCTYAAVPLYRRFCQATGYGGTVTRREVRLKKRLLAMIAIRQSPQGVNFFFLLDVAFLPSLVIGLVFSSGSWLLEIAVEFPAVLKEKKNNHFTVSNMVVQIIRAALCSFIYTGNMYEMNLPILCTINSSTSSALVICHGKLYVMVQEIVVQFNADVADGMQWKFIPTQREVRVKPGESALAFYTAENKSSTPITGVSTYNVTPMKAAVYFNKIQCFCFEEQRLLPGEQIDMPVFFYIDPEFETDPKMNGINNIMLSYTFFKVSEE